MRTRRDVWNLAKDPTDKTLYWYGVAVQEMQTRTFDNPTSWKFQAAVHGYDQQIYPPLRAGEHLPSPGVQSKFWDNCQHASWWFLPWHRMYIFLLEKMCRDIIKSKNGPGDWGLPYWDYSHPAGAVQRTIPKPFRDQNLNGGAPNPLFAVRNAGVNSGNQVASTQQSQDAACLKSKIFSGLAPNGFGGGPSPVVQFAQYTGSCENGPHNSMHDAIGGPTGWMDNPDAAALDPIFWLHHSNIDRLWVIWSKAHGALTDPKWLTQTFQFYNEKGVATTHKVSDVLQTTGPLCDYVYESSALPAVVQPAAAAAQPAAATPAGPGALQGLAAKVMSRSQIIGASAAPGVTLAEGVTSVGVKLHAAAPLAAIAHAATGTPTEQAAVEAGIHLNLENVTAKQNPIHAYEVYVNVPQGDSPARHPELFAGLISRFGLVKASQRGEHHGGQGLNLSFDITEIAAALQKAGKWDDKNVHVTFLPHDVEEAKALAAEGRAVPERNPVHVGRISISTL